MREARDIDRACVRNHANGRLYRMDSLRANLMRHYLNEEGCGEIWKYDIATPQVCLRIAVADQNYDAIAAYDSNASFVLTGPGIEDVYCKTAWDLRKAVRWLCTGYLGCYAGWVSKKAA